MDETDTITVICTDESHPTKTAVIATYVPQQPENVVLLAHPYRWALLHRASIRKPPAPSPDPRGPESNVRNEHLLGDVAYSGQDMSNERRFMMEGRKQNQLRCRLCKTTVSVRMETLDAILDTLAAHAIQSITLHSLGVRVEQHNRAGA